MYFTKLLSGFSPLSGHHDLKTFLFHLHWLPIGGSAAQSKHQTTLETTVLCVLQDKINDKKADTRQLYTTNKAIHLVLYKSKNVKSK